jgi:hypothetical protein
MEAVKYFRRLEETPCTSTRISVASFLSPAAAKMAPSRGLLSGILNEMSCYPRLSESFSEFLLLDIYLGQGEMRQFVRQGLRRYIYGDSSNGQVVPPRKKI